MIIVISYIEIFVVNAKYLTRDTTACNTIEVLTNCILVCKLHGVFFIDLRLLSHVIEIIEVFNSMLYFD